jgi:hypothetical protein
MAQKICVFSYLLIKRQPRVVHVEGKVHRLAELAIKTENKERQRQRRGNRQREQEHRGEHASDVVCF